MRDAREHIEALCGAGDGFGHQLAREAGKRHAVTGKSLHIEHIGCEPSEIRRAAHGDVQVTAPGIRHFDIGERREYSQHALAHGFGQLRRLHGAVTDAAAE